MTEPGARGEPRAPAAGEECADAPEEGDCPLGASGGDLESAAGAQQRVLGALEAVLFMAAEPLDSRELAEILEVPVSEVEALTQSLAALYTARGLQLTRIAGGYQVATRPEYGRFVARLHEPARFRLSRAALETLAIVAYRQPATRPEIDAIRGVSSDSPLDTLLQYELVCDAGRRDAPGRPVLYRTTDSFLGHFGLNSIEDLPRLDSIPMVADEAPGEGSAGAGEGPPPGAGLPAGQEQSEG